MPDEKTPADPKNAEALRKIVDLCAALRGEIEIRETMYKQADKDRRSLLNVAARLAVAYHELSRQAIVSGEHSVSVVAGKHDLEIAECEHPICLESREAMLALGKEPKRDEANVRVREAVKKTGGQNGDGSP
jgi:hypothetical protein